MLARQTDRQGKKKFNSGDSKLKSLFPPGLEPGTFRVLGERDNHYTTETCGIHKGNPRKLCYQKHAYEP